MAKAKRKKSSSPDEWNRKPAAFQIRGSAEWKAWVEDFAAKEGDAVAKLIERSLRKYAKDSGHTEPPPR